MPKITYEDQEYDIVDPDSWTTIEAIRLEQASERKPVELIQDLKQGGALGVHATIWISLHRAGNRVPWNELDIPWYDTLVTLYENPVHEPVDPSTASTEEPKDG